MRYREPVDDCDYPAPAHSGFGIASFTITATAGILECVVVAIACVLEATTPGGIDDNSPSAMFLNQALIGGLMLDLAGIGLGVAGLCDRNRNRLFAVLGVAIGSVVMLGVLFLIVIGLGAFE